MSGTNRSRTPSLPLLAAAGVALMVAQGVLPVIPSDVPGQVAAITHHRGAEVLSAAAFVVAAALLVWGLHELDPRITGRGRRLAGIGLAASAVGSFWLVGGRAAFNLFEVAVTGSLKQPVAVDVTQSVTDSGAFAVLLLTLAAFLLGPVLFGLGLWRAGLAPWWPALLWFAGVVVVASTEASLRIGPSLGMLLLTTALVGWARPLEARGRAVLSEAITVTPGRATGPSSED